MVKSGTTAYSRFVLDLSDVPTVDEFLMQLFEELVRNTLS
jgi:anti-anti-sigma regulatory factor